MRSRHAPQLAGVYEEDFAAPVPEFSISVTLPVAREKPQAGRYLGRVEKLTRQRHHAIHQILLDQVFPDLALAGLARRHGTVRQHETGHAFGREMMNHVLYPGKVGVALGRNAVFPALVVDKPLAAPGGHIERRISQDVIGL